MNLLKKLRNKYRFLSSLKAKSFQGVTWSFIDSIAGSGISFIIGIILARLLTPAAFGLIGMVTVFLVIANTFIDSGFSTGLIRKVKCAKIEYDTVFYFNIATSLLLYLFLFFSAPFLAAFFKEPQLSSLIRILCITIVIDSLSIVQRAILTREINFRLQTKISLISSISSGIIGIGMAYKGFGVWSLVYQILTKQMLNGILLWILSKWRPSANFSVAAFKELFNFGSKILGSSLLASIQNNIYYFVIGKFFSASGLGFYTRAEQFNAIVTNNITGTLERVFFPVLSSIQEDEQHMKATLRKMIRTSFFITYFALISMAIVAKPMIYVLIGDKWGESVLYLQLICIGSVFFPFNIVNLNILKIKGRSDLILRLQIFKTFLTAIIIVSGILWGIAVMLIVRIITTLIATYLNSYYSGKLLGYSIKEQIFDISSYFWSISIILCLMFVLSFVPVNNFLMLSFQTFTGIFLFFLIFERSKHAEYIEIKTMFINLILRNPTNTSIT